MSALADILESFEDAPDEIRVVVLCHSALADVVIDEDELNGALRRAQLLLATGGDPRRPLELDGRAVTSLADDLDQADRRERLGERLAELVARPDRAPGCFDDTCGARRRPRARLARLRCGAARGRTRRP